MLLIAYVGICLKVHKNVLKCSLGQLFSTLQHIFIQFLTFAFLSLFVSFSLLFPLEKKEKKKMYPPNTPPFRSRCRCGG